MPSDKPIFFKPEDFDGLVKFIDGTFLKYSKSNTHITSLSGEVYSGIASVANAKIAPLLSAMEIMRKALREISELGDDWGPEMPYAPNTQTKKAEEALKKCKEILK